MIETLSSLTSFHRRLYALYVFLLLLYHTLSLDGFWMAFPPSLHKSIQQKHSIWGKNHRRWRPSSCFTQPMDCIDLESTGYEERSVGPDVKTEPVHDSWRYKPFGNQVRYCVHGGLYVDWLSNFQLSWSGTCWYIYNFRLPHRRRYKPESSRRLWDDVENDMESSKECRDRRARGFRDGDLSSK